MIFSRTQDSQPATHLQWDAPTARTDGTPYGAADHAGYVLGIADATVTGGFREHVSVPAAYDVTEWPLDQLNITDPGIYMISLATVDVNGLRSAWADPFSFTASYAPPSPPTGLSAS